LLPRGLVDGALADELGLERLDRKAIRLDAAIAAQPSQTISLMTTRLGGSGNSCRFLRLRFSVAQVCT